MSSSHPLLDGLQASLVGVSAHRFIVAYSGGLDSHVLLHLMAAYVGNNKQRLHAVHVDHGFHDDSEQWARHCLSTASQLGVSAIRLTIEERPAAADSIEAWARRQRYLLLSANMQPEDVVLTAHHRGDLAETALLQLFRGTGPHGLASIPERQAFGPGLLVRPLLNVTRTAIREYAKRHALVWIDDPSNASDRYDRNYIRHRVLPVIEKRWPAVAARIGHAVTLQQQAAACLDAAADAVLDPIIGTDVTRLPLTLLRGINEDMQRWVLRRWIVRADFPIPDAVHLQEMQRLLCARRDAEPCVRWKHAELRRHRELLFLRWSREAPDCGRDYPWDLRSPLILPTGVLSAEISSGEGLNAALVAKHDIVVRFRRGGERCHPLGRRHSQSLKRLFQEWGVPAWQRAETPLLFVGGDLAAVANLCICRQFAAGTDEQGWKLNWRPDEGSRGGQRTLRGRGPAINPP